MKLKRRWWTLFRDRRGKYRVRARASNGRKVFASSEGYSRRRDAVINAIKDAGGPLSLYTAELGIELRQGR